jgi:hypothetical protein
VFLEQRLVPDDEADYFGLELATKEEFLLLIFTTFFLYLT